MIHSMPSRMSVREVSDLNPYQLFVAGIIKYGLWKSGNDFLSSKSGRYFTSLLDLNPSAVVREYNREVPIGKAA